MKIFWAWQSDTDGATCRHFIRDALAAAIKHLKEPEDIEDPAERDVKDEMHLDHDREGVSGSPDLARLIFDKIDRSAVFVADVTPVSGIKSRKQTGAKGKTEEKRNMNPNVAIELGYALHRLTDLKILMVLNTHYGDRQYLPFDLKHKAGPITYRLAPRAEKAERDRAFTELRGVFIAALRLFIKVPENSATPVASFVPARSTSSPAVYFQPQDILGTFGVPSDNYRVSYPYKTGFYLRLHPTEPRAQPFPTATLLNEVRRASLWPFWKSPSSLAVDNDYGAIVCEPEKPRDGGALVALTQVFRSGEIWGLALWLMVENIYGKFIPAELFETAYRDTLTRYLAFLITNLKIPPPYEMVAGAVGIKGFEVAIDHVDLRWQVLDDEFAVHRRIASSSPQVVRAAVLAISSALYALTGYERPAGHLKNL